MMLDRSFTWRAALFTGVLGLIVSGLVGWAYLHELKESRQHAANSLAQGFALRVVERFHETMGPVFMLASVVRQYPLADLKFDVLAGDLIHEFPLIRALELAPGGVVSQVYPLRGNEMIIGHDLLRDRERNKEAHTALIKRQLTLAGPIELKQGGLGAVARYPIFTAGRNGKSSFWGFSIAVINVPELLAIAGEMEFERGGYDYRLCRMPLEDEECKIFARRGDAPMETAVSVRIGLPNNNWLLSVAPRTAWVTGAEKWLVMALVLLAALLAGGIQYLMLSRLTTKAD